MGVKRVVDKSFWMDGGMDDFSPEDKYFYLYLMTNPFSTQLGIYEISIKQAAFQLGYSMDAVKVLIERFQNKYNLIIYDPKTNEIAIKNYLKHAIVKGGAPVRDCLIREINEVKNKELIEKVFKHIKGDTSLNETVRNLLEEYEKIGIGLRYTNDNKKDNDNENEVSAYDSKYESRNIASRSGNKKQFSGQSESGKREYEEDQIRAVHRMMREEKMQ